ncbi:MAG TPA: penicillin-binding transpeptidase domain-containing protein [Paenibacillus sp.]|uniref:peptidoglycan D,D-transpeptidase FtsI family protein n=1 Tax=Paenibacillus sp. TaxID=58172 RepID=UPI002BCBECD6|nr:penicillin-binding transpeptidase domain-containing protein [Paenibacillus sp.]HUC91366.1 penicillin-binding transpeptidase domain-containing protein [Paenibacillus sp.]
MTDKRRIFVLAAAFAGLAAVYLMRLFLLQGGGLPSAEKNGLVVQAVRQRQEVLVLDTGRGDFVDRYGAPITGGAIYGVAAFPAASGGRVDAAAARRLAAAMDVEYEMLADWLAGLKEPDWWRGADGNGPPAAFPEALDKAIRTAGVPGVYLLPYHIRYAGDKTGIHAIGFIGQHPELTARLYAPELARGDRSLSDTVGGIGLERSLDRLLQGAGPTVAYRSRSAEADTRGIRAADELKVKAPDNPYFPLTVVTTLDLGLQRKLEAYAARNGLKEGAIVVLDARNADIAAIVSRPELDPFSISEGADETVNRALRAAAPGSVFKLVTEAAALETGRLHPKETFHCEGEYGKYGLSCWLPGGHGRLTLIEALAQSCNVAFAEIAERLTADELDRTADRLGLGRRVGWQAAKSGEPPGPVGRLLEEEEAGRIFARIPRRRDGGLLAQTGIGQRDVSVTPLQAANLMVTLLHGGDVSAPRIVKEIRYADGRLMARLPARRAPSRFGRVSPATASALLQGMEAVVSAGTGKPLQRAQWRLAGKSGTAQAVAVNGAPVNHQWFVGYGPVESPRYAVAVLAGNRPAGSANQATALYRGVMDIIAAHEKASRSG